MLAPSMARPTLPSRVAFDLRHDPDVQAAYLLTSALLLACVGVLQAGHVIYEPGRPLYLEMPAAYLLTVPLAVLAFGRATSPRLRIGIAAASAALMVIPVVVLLPFGHLHDSNRNLLISTETVAGHATNMYRDAYPGYWTLIGLFKESIIVGPWEFLRWYPVAATAIYFVVAYATGYAILQKAGVNHTTAQTATAACLVVMFTFGPMIWIRNNLAPESYGFAIGMLMTYFAARRQDGVAFVVLFFLAAGALIVSHPLSPLLVAPGIVAVVGVTDAGIWKSVRNALQSATRVLVVPTLVLYVAWLLFRSTWILNHAKLIVAEALEQEKRVTGLNRTLPGTEWVVYGNLLFLGLLGLGVAPFLFRSFRSRLGKLSLLWLVFMSPLLAGAAGGKFFSRPLLFLLLPFGLVAGLGFAVGLKNVRWRAVAAVALVVASGLGMLRAGYVESVDHVSPDEIAAYGFTYGRAEDVYRTSMSVHYLENGSRLDSGDLLLGGGRGYDVERAGFFPVRLMTDQGLAYGAIQERFDWPMDVQRGAAATGEPVSLVYENDGAAVLEGPVRERGAGVGLT